MYIADNFPLNLIKRHLLPLRIVGCDSIEERMQKGDGHSRLLSNQDQTKQAKWSC